MPVTSTTRNRPRRQRAADAAIEVIAADGLRGLTHRAVDAKAGLPVGSTSSCFRTRLALLSGVLDRLVELDEAWAEQIPTTGWSVATAEDQARIVDVYTDLLAHWLGPARSRTLARMELYLDAMRRSELSTELEAASRRFVVRAAAGMREVGVTEPEEAARVLLAGLDGILYSALARPFLGGAERAGLRRSVEVMLRGFVP
ncbi:transcriptional regulator, TetR family [Actinoalloteichus sp. GBA129-24]|nr:transcriptional regulator, TetR family [Actinoalloteichus sp. GBA129-24]